MKFDEEYRQASPKHNWLLFSMLFFAICVIPGVLLLYTILFLYIPDRLLIVGYEFTYEIFPNLKLAYYHITLRGDEDFIKYFVLLQANMVVIYIVLVLPCLPILFYAAIRHDYNQYDYKLQKSKLFIFASKLFIFGSIVSMAFIILALYDIEPFVRYPKLGERITTAFALSDRSDYFALWLNVAFFNFLFIGLFIFLIKSIFSRFQKKHGAEE